MAPSQIDLSPAGLDVRGQRVRAEITPVLADPAGVRARRLARFGRVVAVLCLLWVAGLGLAGLGILPAGDLPLGRALTGTGPAAMRVAPTPVPPSDLVAATPANTGTASATLDSAARVPQADRRGESVALHGSPGGAGAGRGHRGLTATGGGGSSAPANALAPVGSAPGESSVAGVTGTAGAASGTFAGTSRTAGGGGTYASGHGRAVAPGQTVRQTARGRSSTTARANSATAPGHVKQTTTASTTTATAPGLSGASPGHAVTHGSGHANGA